jgi:hypothetical protein
MGHTDGSSNTKLFPILILGEFFWVIYIAYDAINYAHISDDASAKLFIWEVFFYTGEAIVSKARVVESLNFEINHAIVVFTLMCSYISFLFRRRPFVVNFSRRFRVIQAIFVEKRG